MCLAYRPFYWNRIINHWCSQVFGGRHIVVVLLSCPEYTTIIVFLPYYSCSFAVVCTWWIFTSIASDFNTSLFIYNMRPSTTCFTGINIDHIIADSCTRLDSYSNKFQILEVVSAFFLENKKMNPYLGPSLHCSIKYFKSVLHTY